MRLKTDTVENDSIATDTTLDSDACAFHAEQWNTGCSGTSFFAVAVAMSVAGIVATALALNALAAMQAGTATLPLSTVHQNVAVAVQMDSNLVAVLVTV